MMLKNSSISIFTIPKAFVGHINTIQNNAINSWKRMAPTPEIFLFGDDEGIDVASKRHGVLHIKNVKKNVHGTPYLDYIFDFAQKTAINDYMMFINADIIFTSNIQALLDDIPFDKFIVTGRRIDVDITSEVDYSNPQELASFKDRVSRNGVFHSFAGKDYFIFKKGTVNMLPFVVGRPGWDDWLLYHMRSKRIPIIDSSVSIKAIHQNHDYSHSKFGEKYRVSGPEWQDNANLVGSLTNILSTRDADWILSGAKIEKPRGVSLVLNILSYFYIWRLLLAIKRRISLELQK
jgi:hypothetical protein